MYPPTSDLTVVRRANLEAARREALEVTRQRKVREPCPICAASRILCLCDAVPRIELKTKIALVIHHRELSRNSKMNLRVSDI